MSGRLDSNQRPPEPHLRWQVANPWHSSPYTFNNTQETQDFNGFAKGLLRSVMCLGWCSRHSLPALRSGPRLPRPAPQRSLPTPDTPAIASTSKAGARLHRLAAGLPGAEKDRVSPLPAGTIAAFPGDAGHPIPRCGVRGPSLRIALLTGGDGWHIRDLVRAAAHLGYPAEPVDFRRVCASVGGPPDPVSTFDTGI